MSTTDCATLLECAQQKLNSREAKADLISTLATCLVNGGLSAAQFRQVRLAVSDTNPLPEDTGYLRALRDLLRAAESKRIELDQDQQVKELISHRRRSGILAILANGPLGPGEIAKRLNADQAAISRDLQAVESLGLVAPAEQCEDGRSRRRELTARGHQVANGISAQPSEHGTDRDIKIIKAAIAALTDVQALGTLSLQNMALLVRRNLPHEEPSEFLSQFLLAASVHCLVEKDGTNIRWAKQDDRSSQARELVRNKPEIWDEAVGKVVVTPYYLVVKDPNAWREALVCVKKHPLDICTPKSVDLKDMAESTVVSDQPQLAKYLGAEKILYFQMTDSNQLELRHP